MSPWHTALYSVSVALSAAGLVAACFDEVALAVIYAFSGIASWYIGFILDDGK